MGFVGPDSHDQRFDVLDVHYSAIGCTALLRLQWRPSSILAIESVKATHYSGIRLQISIPGSHLAHYQEYRSAWLHDALE